MPDPDLRLARIAARQFSAFSRAQAHRCGLSNKQIRARVAANRWQLMHHGSFRILGAPASRESEIAAAVLAMPESWISHGSSAFMWDRFDTGDRTPEISRLHGRGQALDGVRVHQSTDLPPHHVTRLGALPITTRARTIFDLATVLDDVRLGRYLDDQIVRRKLRLGQVERVFGDLAGVGRNGTARMARLLDARVGEPPSESELEARFVTLCRARGLPCGEPQFRAPWATDAARERVDFAYPAERLIVELDGRRYHAQLDAMANDRRRDQLATASGWRTLRFTWFQVFHEPAFVESILRASLLIADVPD